MKAEKWLRAVALLVLLCALAACASAAPGSPVRYERSVQSPTSPVSLICTAEGELVGQSLSLQEASAKQYLAAGQEVEAYIYTSLLAEHEEIDLTAYKIPTDRITAVFTDVMNRYPDLFFVQPGISYTYTSDGHVVTLKPTYRMTGEMLAQARLDYEQHLDAICEGVDRAWSDFEIALYLHDYLCLHFAYDTSFQVFDAYQFLIGGKGVCQAYTLTYMALLSRFGIVSDVAVSEQMNHIWNVVTLGGQPYHVDVTWDDPIPDVPGVALHQSFLRSDAGIAESGHYAWVSDHTCASDAYERTFLAGVNTPFSYTTGQWFYADGAQRAVFAVDFSTMTESKVLGTEEVWLTPDGDSYYVDAFWGVGTYRGNLIYNTPEQLWAHNLQSGVTVKIRAELPRGMQIFGLWVDGDVVYYNVSETPDGEMQTLCCSIAQLADYIPGDADQNGSVDGRDLTAILRYLAGLPTVCHTGAADFDDSGEVDERDVYLLRRYLVENK